jgi:hypothetical protein
MTLFIGSVLVGPKADGNAYSKMEEEVAKINDKVAQAQDA